MQSIQNPFPGLRPFGYDQRHLFFGREKQVTESLKQLQNTRFLMVVGPSGSGKSSLIHAGLLPGLYGSQSAGNSWKTAVLRPGDDPIGNMAHALMASDAVRTDETEPLRNGRVALTELVQNTGMSAGEHLLLFVDQFEEIFRYDTGGAFTFDEADIFVQHLLNAFRQPACPIYVLLTMRADFLGRCTAFPGLPEAINVGQYLIPRLDPNQIRDAIVEPIRVSHAEIAPNLVDQLLDDLEDNQDQLPIMQHAMMRTWDYWAENDGRQTPIDEVHYEAIGTIREALSQHAEEVYDELPDDEAKRITQILFKCLTDRTTNPRGGRRPTPLREVCDVSGADLETVKAVVEHFRCTGRWFLTPYPGVELREETILDLVHESLMRVWRQLETWVEEEGASAVLYLRLANTAALYQEGRAGLYQGPDLELALNWQVQNRPTAAWAQRYDPTFERANAFLEHSKKERDFEIATREAQQRRQLKRARLLALSGGGVAVIFLLLSLFALDLYFKSEENRKQAETQQKIAEQQRQVAERERQNAIVQQQLAEEERQKAIAQRQVAERERQNAIVQQQIAERESQVAEQQRQKAETQQKIAEQQRQIAERQEKIAVEEKDKAYRLRLLSVARSLAIQAVKIKRDGQIDLGALLALQAFSFNQKYGGPAQDPNIYQALRLAMGGLDQNARHALRGHEDGVRDLAFYPDGATLVSAGDDGRIDIWDMRSLERKRTLRPGGNRMRALAVSPDAQWLAAGDTSGEIWVWPLNALDAQPTRLLAPAALENTLISSLAFSPEGTHLAGGSLDGNIWVWRTGQWAENPVVSLSDNGRVQAVAFSPSGQYLTWADSEGLIRLVDLENASQPPEELKREKGAILTIDFSPDSRWLAAGKAGGDILIWDVRAPYKDPVRLIGHTSSVTAVRFSPDSRLLASGSLDRTVRIWNVQSPGLEPILIEHDQWVWSVAFSPDGNRLVSGSADQVIYIWTTRAKALAEQVCGKISRNMDIKEWKTFVGEDIPYEKTCPDLPGGEQASRNTAN